MTRRQWLLAATVGFALVLCAFVVVGLVIGAKEQFGGLVGSSFLGTIVAMVMGGALALLIAVWKLPERSTLAGRGVLAWGLLAVSSPAFGIMFLLPWGVLALSAPLVGAALVKWFRA